MVTDIVVVFLLLIGLGTVIYWIMKFAFWFMNKLMKKSDDYETMKEKNYSAMKEEMNQFDQQTLNLAYLYAKSLTSFGIDITEKWETATEQSANLEKAYRKGFYEGVAAKLNEKDLNRIIVIPNNITRKELHKAIFGVNPPELDSPYCSCARGKGGCEKCKHKDDLNCDVNWWNAPYKKEETNEH